MNVDGIAQPITSWVEWSEEQTSRKDQMEIELIIDKIYPPNNPTTEAMLLKQRSNWPSCVTGTVYIANEIMQHAGHI